MRDYIYKVAIFAIAIIVIFEFTIGKEISQINEKVNYFTTTEGRKQLISSIKKEIRKANESENYLDDEEKILLKNFILKIKKELSLN
tara:strand:+ start:597 stop:857 length:261 start_codon:yes stop_codon:yes gene_type:complete